MFFFCVPEFGVPWSDEVLFPRLWAEGGHQVHQGSQLIHHQTGDLHLGGKVQTRHEDAECAQLPAL